MKLIQGHSYNRNQTIIDQWYRVQPSTIQASHQCTIKPFSVESSHQSNITHTTSTQFSKQLEKIDQYRHHNISGGYKNRLTRELSPVQSKSPRTCDFHEDVDYDFDYDYRCKIGLMLRQQFNSNSALNNILFHDIL